MLRNHEEGILAYFDLRIQNGIVEAMKLMNEIEAEISGKIVKIIGQNGQPVEYNQPLFLVEKT
jgi:biotin carboxyl carrier protein